LQSTADNHASHPFPRISSPPTFSVQASGPDTGFDSVGDFPQAASLARYLDKLDNDNRLPKTVLYNLNPADNYVFAAMDGTFQDDTVPAKVQFGSGWWFPDQKEGMQRQINAPSNLGLLSRFVGMLTDPPEFPFPAPRIFPPHPMRNQRPRCREWRTAPRYQAAGSNGRRHILPQRRKPFRSRVLSQASGKRIDQLQSSHP